MATTPRPELIQLLAYYVTSNSLCCLVVLLFVSFFLKPDSFWVQMRYTSWCWHWSKLVWSVLIVFLSQVRFSLARGCRSHVCSCHSCGNPYSLWMAVPLSTGSFVVTSDNVSLCISIAWPSLIFCILRSHHTLLIVLGNSGSTSFSPSVLVK